jgi:hypothetical protein
LGLGVAIVFRGRCLVLVCEHLEMLVDGLILFGQLLEELESLLPFLRVV